MSNESRRDESVDRLLRTSMKGALSGPTTACIEAETLAAWADGALAARERERVEAHVSSCANCQALVAAFARSLPEPAGSATGVAPAFWTLWRLGWIGAATTAAVAVTVWLSLPRVSQGPPPATMMASREAVPQPSPLPAAPQAKEEPPPAPSSNTVAGPAANRSTASPEKSQSLRREAAASPPPVAESRADASRPMAPPPPAPPSKPPDVVGAAPLIQAASGERSSTVVRSQLENLTSATGAADHNFLGYINIQPGVSANNRVGGGGQANYMLDGLSAMDATLVAEIVPPPAPTAAFSFASPSSASGPGAGVGGRGGGGGGGGGRGGQAPPVSTPASSATRWRIFANGQVDRVTASAPQGQRAVFEPPVFITAGSAPSPLVCWLVGRAGAVFLTVDGEQFRRVASPEVADLVSVSATSALQVSVTTAQGTLYTSSDGGTTWRRLP